MQKKMQHTYGWKKGHSLAARLCLCDGFLCVMVILQVLSEKQIIPQQEEVRSHQTFSARCSPAQITLINSQMHFNFHVGLV